ncbi:methyltransferase [Desulfobacca acetoxidans]|uniref:Methyltransferase type 12 n=1 Tax=Desulfobacca acetoxidans (strain ATCC 700848 / DSM 11109 / ASRB2) TaxID=880072 RepID=F2NFZ3_DESAR|nr:methyltransferase [Desulfobacca acetoxidans]AEB08406.1 Methyltransferase type 12 [Desulfobacca acetoxidans DSM 11109]
MSLDKHRLGHNFGRRAAGYHRYALVQGVMAEQLLADLKQYGRQYSRILEIGCGVGHYTQMLRRAFPEALITAVDLAPAAIQVARQRLAAEKNIEWLMADGEEIVRGRFDLITANSVFQWLSQPDRACRLYWQSLQPGGCLAFTTLGPRTFSELAASLVRASQKFPGLRLPEVSAQTFAAAPNWRNCMAQAGFEQIVVHEELRLEYHPDFWNLLRAIQGMGATSTRPTFIPKRLLTAAEEYYERNYRRNGCIPASYEVIRVQGVKN